MIILDMLKFIMLVQVGPYIIIWTYLPFLLSLTWSNDVHVEIPRKSP